MIFYGIRFRVRGAMRFFSYILLPFLFLSYLGIDTYLKLNHSALCHTRGCELAEGLIRIDSLSLNYIGIVSAILLLFLGVLVYKELISKKIFTVYLASCIVFETIMLGYQFFASPELCKFCLGVYGFLLVTMLFSSGRYFLYLIPLILAPFVALSLLTIPSFNSFVKKDGTYLIQSPTCPHCKKVKSYLNEKKIPFVKLKASDIEDRNFIKFLGYKTIPLLIVKKGSHITIVNGDEDIINYFKSRDSQNFKETQSSSIDLLGESKNSDGCEIDLSFKPDCTKEK